MTDLLEVGNRIIKNAFEAFAASNSASFEEHGSRSFESRLLALQEAVEKAEAFARADTCGNEDF